MIAKTLYFGSAAKLSLRQRQIVVWRGEVSGPATHYDPEAAPQRTIAIEDVGLIVLAHPQIVITQALLAALMEQCVAVVSCDSHYLPAGVLLPFSANNLYRERTRQQLEATQPLIKRLWQQTVTSKISNQAALIHAATGQVAPNLLRMAEAVKSGDPENLEARAAAWYWKHLFEDAPAFTRQRDGDATNTLLNYGYAVLRAVIARALVMAGLLPVCGIHHRNKYNPYCLADDIMEPYRPVVDALVLELRSQLPSVPPPAPGEEAEDPDILPEPAILTPAVKRRLLEISALDVVIDGRRSPLMIAASRTAASLARCYAGEARKILYPRLCCEPAD